MCLCSATKDTFFRDLGGIINAFGISHLSLTPTVAALIDPVKVPTVEFLVTAGEALTPKVFESWAGRGLYQGYGPSETTNICIVNSNMERKQNINNLGLPLSNTSTFILELHDGFELIPRGGVGELCFGGSQVVYTIQCDISVSVIMLICYVIHCIREEDTSTCPTLPQGGSSRIPDMGGSIEAETLEGFFRMDALSSLDARMIRLKYEASESN